MSEPPRPPTVVEQIEKDTLRQVTIESTLNKETFAKCNPQGGSPLFNKIPAELRNDIFELVLAPYDDAENVYPPNQHYYRPDIPARQKFSLDLLRTCRLVWLEANHIPLPQAVFPFYYSEERAPPFARSREDSSPFKNPTNLVNNLTVLGQTRIHDIRCFAQLYSSSEAVRDLYRPTVTDGGPEVVRLMVRHGDWWWWEDDSPLDFHPFFPRSLLRCHVGKRLKEVRVELETLEWKVHQLGPIVEQIRAAPIQGRGIGRRLELQPQGTIPDSTWSGPTNLAGRDWDQHRARNQLDYRVVTILWKVVNGGIASEPSPAPRRSARLEQRTDPEALAARDAFEEKAKKDESLLFLTE